MQVSTVLCGLLGREGEEIDNVMGNLYKMYFEFIALKGLETNLLVCGAAKSFATCAHDREEICSKQAPYPSNYIQSINGFECIM